LNEPDTRYAEMPAAGTGGYRI